MRLLQESILEADVNHVNINRLNIMDGTIRAIKRSSFKPLARLSVKFSDDEGGSEGAVDAGGPTREFLRLLIRKMETSCVFEGPATS